MWDQFVGNEATTISDLIETRPVIIAARLKVVSYNDMIFVYSNNYIIFVLPL